MVSGLSCTIRDWSPRRFSQKIRSSSPWITGRGKVEPPSMGLRSFSFQKTPCLSAMKMWSAPLRLSNHKRKVRSR
ncbi:MAG: hypothetical protein BWY88_01232 [Synergistetes bacterium ADurb.Bin520]|nr:MAG: hypothetical protein BWY88_01232 [Synergistetes bacterium ADurb.Bin520]